MVAHRFFGIVITKGNLTVTDAKGVTKTYGDGTGEEIHITLHSRKAEWRVLLNPMLAVGECYMDETFTVEKGTIYDFLSMAAKNFKNLDKLFIFRLLTKLEVPLRHLRTFNPASRARKNVAHHYDLSGELYDLFLDEDRQYSCAYFRQEDDTLEQAQFNKKKHIANKLLLDKPGLKILDIGSGWGGMGLFLAEINGGQVDGVTLSEEQHKLSNARAEEAGVCRPSFDGLVCLRFRRRCHRPVVQRSCRKSRRRRPREVSFT